MKVRDGFVSNSSSMSFLVSRDAYQNVFELAKAIVINRFRGWKNEDGEWDDHDRYLEDYKPSNEKIIQRLKEAEDRGIHPNTTVYIYSANSDIYAGLFHDSYIVETDRNNEYRDDLQGVIKWDLLGDFSEGEWTEDDAKNAEVYENWMNQRTIYMHEYDLCGRYMNRGNLTEEDHCEENENHRYIPIMHLFVKKEDVGMDYTPNANDPSDDPYTIIDACPACMATQIKDRRENAENNNVDHIIARLADGDDDNE